MLFVVRLIHRGGRVDHVRLPAIPQLGWIVCAPLEHLECKSHPKIFVGARPSDRTGEVLTGDIVAAEIEVAFARDRNGRRTDRPKKGRSIV